MIVAAYRELYCVLVDWGLRMWGRKDEPEFTALIFLTTIAVMNVFSLAFLGSWVIGHRGPIPVPRLAAALMWVAFFGLHYVLLKPGAGSGHPSQEDAAGRLAMKRKWLLLLYPIASFGLYWSVIIVREAFRLG